MERDTKQQHRETIRRLAAESFKDHVLTEIGTAGDTRVFRCGRPGSGIYGFRVLVWPGWFVVAGDVGDTMFRHSDHDSLGWLRGAKGDTKYLLGKVQGARMRFMPGDAEAFIREQIAEMEEQLVEKTRTIAKDRLREQIDRLRALDFDTDGEHDYHAACSEAGVDDPPSCTEYDSDHVWAVEALRWFIGALDAQKKEAA